MALKEQKLLCLVDVGAMGGLQDKWMAHADKLWPVMIEANPIQLQHLSDRSSLFPKATIVECALANLDGPISLWITRNPTCISAIEPNQDLLSNYGIKVHFEITGRHTAEAARYDTLCQNGRAPRPDVIKIDVQGFEYEVLLGFGGLLSNCLGIELETHFYPLYRGQKLLHDLISLLDTYGLVLRRLDTSSKLSHFDGDLIEADAYFTKSRRAMRKLDSVQRTKFALLTEVWQLPPYVD
jgi:FkbM family methyltransferase